MDEETLKYIGYSMSKKKWFIIKSDNIRCHSIRCHSIRCHSIRFDTYEFLNAGATSLVYFNKASNRVVKIIRGSAYKSNDTFIQESQKEVSFQKKAAKFGLAPKVFHHGFVKKQKSFLYPDDIIPYYYIVMEYLAQHNGWEHVFADDKPELFCKFISDLVDKVGIINIIDPQTHFYYNEIENKLLMIDYDRCVSCVHKQQCKIDMTKALGIRPTSDALN